MSDTLGDAAFKYSPGDTKLRDAFYAGSRWGEKFMIEECAKVCESYVMALCEDEGNGGVSHDAACRSLAGQIRALGK